MNYRKFYKDYYGIDFDDYFEVHHIDRNRKNNNIDNLLLLLSELHRQFHFNLNILEKYKFKFNLDNYKVIGFQALPLNEKIKTEIKEHINARW